MHHSPKCEETLPALPALRGKGGKMALAILIVFPLLFGALALFLGQDANWDFRNYHWYNGYAAVNERFYFDLLPSQLPFFYNPLLDIPYYLLASHVPAKIAAFILGSVQGLNFILLFMLCHATLIIANKKQKIWVCTVLAALGLLGGGGIAQIGTTFYDNITSLGLFTSALLVLRFLPEMTSGTRWGRVLALAFLCGLPGGLMMGFKLPFATFCVGLCGALLFVKGTIQRRVWIAFGFGLGVLLGWTITYASWAVHLQTAYLSPVFPYFNGVFKSPYFEPLSFRDSKFIPETLWGKLTFPFVFTAHPKLVGEVPWRDLRIAILYVLVPVCFLVRLAYGRNKQAADRLTNPLATRYLLWAGVLSYFVWLLFFSIYRYLLPLEMLSPLLIVIALGLCPVRPQIRALLAGLILLVTAVTVQPADWGRRTPWLDHAVEVTYPDLGETKGLMILMAGTEPYAHVVPSFPPEIAFVRIQSNITSPNEDKGLNNIIRDKVMAHHGHKKILIPDFDEEESLDALRFFNLTFDKKSCQPVEDALYDSRLIICDITPLTTPRTP